MVQSNLDNLIYACILNYRIGKIFAYPNVFEEIPFISIDLQVLCCVSEGTISINTYEHMSNSIIYCISCMNERLFMNVY